MRNPFAALAAAIVLLACGPMARAAAPKTLDEFGAALDAAQVPAAIATLTGDAAVLAHIQAMASSGAPASVALARTCAAILARHEVAGAAALAAASQPASAPTPIDAAEGIRLAALVDHLVDLCDTDEAISARLPQELMEAIARDCPGTLARATAAQYLTDLAIPPSTADAMQELAPLSAAAHALEAATDALLAPPGGHLSLEALHLLKAPEEFFDRYIRIKATQMPRPTREGLEAIIDNLLRRVAAARAADATPEAQEILKAFARQLQDIRTDAAERAAFLMEQQQLRTAAWSMVDAANRADAAKLKPWLDPALIPAANLRTQISGVADARHIALLHVAMEEPDDAADASRTLQVFLMAIDEVGHGKPVKVAATFKRNGTAWVLTGGLGFTHP